MFVKVANSPRMLVAVFVFTMLVSAGIYQIAEGESFLDSIYWALVTATTLGYGDFSPDSVVGKALTCALIVFTLFVLIPMITANLASRLIVDRDAFTHDEQEEIKDVLRQLVARSE